MVGQGSMIDLSPKEVDASGKNSSLCLAGYVNYSAQVIFSLRNISKCNGQEKVQGLGSSCGLHCKNFVSIHVAFTERKIKIQKLEQVILIGKTHIKTNFRVQKKH